MTHLIFSLLVALTPVLSFAEDINCQDTRLRNSGFRLVFTGVGTRTSKVDLSLPVGRDRIENFEGSCHQSKSEDGIRLSCDISTNSGNYHATLSRSPNLQVLIEKKDSTLEPLQLNCDL